MHSHVRLSVSCSVGLVIRAEGHFQRSCRSTCLNCVHVYRGLIANVILCECKLKLYYSHSYPMSVHVRCTYMCIYYIYLVNQVRERVTYRDATHLKRFAYNMYVTACQHYSLQDGQCCFGVVLLNWLNRSIARDKRRVTLNLTSIDRLTRIRRHGYKEKQIDR